MREKRNFTKKTVVLFLSIAMLSLFLLPTASAATADVFPDGSSEVRVTLDGKLVLSGQAAIIDGVTYVPLRSFSELAGADDISWNEKTRTATVTKGSVTMYVTDGGTYVQALGRYFHTVQKVLNIDNRLYVPIRPLAKVFSIDVNWNADTRTVILTSTGKTLKAASAYYNADDLYWLSRIISAESAGEPLAGQIAVGNVVLNRKAHKSFPNTVYGVIFDRVGGTQFTPVAIGTIYRTPSEQSVIAAKICLEGYSISDEALFFMNPKIATSNWISRNCRFLFRIDNHSFYGLYP